jgi:tetratricopeptide (TPR) repeat protein
VPVEQIRARLGDRFHLLTGGSRVALPRQQTLRAAVDWSYDLLSEPERTLFRRLSVFAGGWSAEAAEALAGPLAVTGPLANSGPVDEPLDLQDRLVDKSLVLLDTGPEAAGPGTTGPQAAGGETAGPGAARAAPARYRMLESMHQYAAERLAEGGEVAAVREGHSAYFVALAREAEPHLGDFRRDAWLERLAADHENLRAALAYLRESGRAGQALSLAGALWRYWEVRGNYAEGRAQLAELLEQAGASAEAPERAKALLGAGAMAQYQGDYAPASVHYAEAMDLYRGLEDQAGVAWTGIYQGWLANEQGDFAAARALLGESLAIARPLGDRQAIGWALSRLAMAAAFEEDYAPARAYLDECVPLLRQIGDKLGLAQALNQLGLVLMQMKDFEAAQATEEESFVLCHELGDRRDLGYATAVLAFVFLQQGQAEAALPLMKESLSTFRELGDKWGSVIALAGMALLAAMHSQLELAVRLAAAASVQHRVIGGVAPAGLNTLLGRVVGGASRSLGDRAATLEAEGSALTLDQAGALALEQL